MTIPLLTLSLSFSAASLSTSGSTSSHFPLITFTLPTSKASPMSWSIFKRAHLLCHLFNWWTFSSRPSSFSLRRAEISSVEVSRPEAIFLSSASLSSIQSKAPFPTTASILLIPAATALSLIILSNPISPLRATWVPPQTSILNFPMFTVLTLSSYFDSNKAIAPLFRAWAKLISFTRRGRFSLIFWLRRKLIRRRSFSDKGEK